MLRNTQLLINMTEPEFGARSLTHRLFLQCSHQNQAGERRFPKSLGAEPATKG